VSDPPRRSSAGFILAGVLCIVAGTIALASGGPAVMDALRWMVPVGLLATGAVGLVRVVRRHPGIQP
jgi:uncharacterized membrane protein HdeD (DUF308 family)